MKKIIPTFCALTFMMNACAQKKETKKTIPVQHTNFSTTANLSILKNSILGTWKIVDVQGKAYYRNVPQAPEMEIPLNLLINNKFNFGVNQVSIKDSNNNSIKKATYKISDDSKRLIIVDYTDEQGINFSITNGKLTLIQTPELYYYTTQKSMNIPLEEVKKQFRVPSDIIITLTK